MSDFSWYTFSVNLLATMINCAFLNACYSTRNTHLIHNWLIIVARRLEHVNRMHNFCSRNWTKTVYRPKSDKTYKNIFSGFSDDIFFVSKWIILTYIIDYRNKLFESYFTWFCMVETLLYLSQDILQICISVHIFTFCKC